jgi:hypothetical protein
LAVVMAPLLLEQEPAWLRVVAVVGLAKLRVGVEVQRVWGLAWWAEVQAQELQVHPVELPVP